ncbi:hypothetical protein K0M31_012131 [Melipona bicolor]|uniref:Uncharacterized protein n=1 Tax=Melipona bicolor TaxID=60889 RepID=A0AA40KVF2_9HYME|nr:hypothetical protein K0M31_012131 [Melipona bicolor]
MARLFTGKDNSRYEHKGRRNVLAKVRIHRWLAASYMEYRVLFESSARMSRKRRCRRGTSPFKAYTEADKRFDIVYKAPNTTSGLLVDASKGLPPVSSAFYAATPCLLSDKTESAEKIPIIGTSTPVIQTACHPADWYL